MATRTEATPRMDATRFDDLTRSVADARSRRSARGSLLAAMLGLLGFADAVSAKGKQSRHPLSGLLLQRRLLRRICVSVGQSVLPGHGEPWLRERVDAPAERQWRQTLYSPPAVPRRDLRLR